MAHPGMLGSTTSGDCRPLLAFGDLTLDEVVGVLASLAATIADLHEIGAPLGGFSAEDVALEPAGRPVLLHPTHLDEHEPDVAVADVKALGWLLHDLLPDLEADGSATAPAAWWRARADRLLRRTHAAPRQAVVRIGERARAATPSGPSARWVADRLAAAVPTARLPRSGEDAELGGRRRERVAAEPQVVRAVPLPMVGLIAVAALVASVMTVRTFTGHRPSRPRLAKEPVAGSTASPAHGPASAPGPAPTTAGDPGPADDAGCPAVTTALHGDVDGDGCDDAVHVDNGVLTSPVGRFSFGTAADHIAIGRWSCAATATPALLRPTGEVFVADSWATPGKDVTTRLVATVAGATDISAVDSDNDGCDEIVVHRGDGSTTTVRPRSGP